MIRGSRVGAQVRTPSLNYTHTHTRACVAAPFPLPLSDDPMTSWPTTTNRWIRARPQVYVQASSAAPQWGLPQFGGGDANSPLVHPRRPTLRSPITLPALAATAIHAEAAVSFN